MSDNEPEIPFDAAEKALHQGEVHLSAQLQSAIAADQRAMTVAAFFVTIATAVAAGSVAYWDKSGDVPILVAGLIGALIMAVGAFLCLWAARPVDFYFPGNHPASWEDVIRRPLNEVLWGEALNYQDMIETNAGFLNKNSKLLFRGAGLAAAAPMIAVAIWVVATLICSSSPEVGTSDGSRLQSSSDGTSRNFL